MRVWKATSPAGIGFVSFALLTLIFWISDLDERGCALGYTADKPHWTLMSLWPCPAIHRMGAWPGVVLLAASGAGWMGSFIIDEFKPWRRPCLFVLLVIVIGPGLLINGLTKPLGHRPRPYETQRFGGTQPYVRPFESGRHARGSSLLSGHASMAFAFLCPFFFLKDPWRWPALMAGIMFGLIVGAVRVIRGDHYPSDILLSGALVFTVAAGLRPMLRPAAAA